MKTALSINHPDIAAKPTFWLKEVIGVQDGSR